MNKPYYIITQGVIYRKGNTVYYQNKNLRKALPINTISEMHCISKTTVKSGAAYFLMKKGIPVFFYDEYGNYVGQLSPRKQLISGTVLVKQVEKYLQPDERRSIAKEMISGVRHNLEWCIKQKLTVPEKQDFEGINAIRQYEGMLWDEFYNVFSQQLKSLSFKTRTRRPPKDELNALISFGNSLLYSVSVKEIYQTYLSPEISYVHEPLERRYSLSLDIADIFKPIFIFPLIRELVNKRIINNKHFRKIDDAVLLNDKGKAIFLEYFDKRLEKTVKHKTLNRKVSYRHLIRLELYKLVKHVLDDQEYLSFKAWW